MLHPEFGLRQRSRSFDRSSCWTLNMEPGGSERMAAGGAINRSNLQRPPPPAFHSQTNLLMNQHTFEDSPPYSLLSDGPSGNLYL